MIVFLVICAIVLFIILTILHVVNDMKSNGSGYRYSDIPSDVNMLEQILIFIVAVDKILPPVVILAMAVVQAVICVHSIIHSTRHRRPYWFDWV